MSTVAGTLMAMAIATWALVLIVAGAGSLAVLVSLAWRKWRGRRARSTEPTLRETIRSPALLEKRLLSRVYELNLLIRAARLNNMHPQVGITTRTDPAHPDGVPQVDVRVVRREGGV